MSDILSQLFDKLLDGQCTPEVFERELLALCSSSPERAWQALALLDRYFRLHKISDRLCRALRQQIGACAMRLEGHAVESPLHEPELDEPDSDPLFAATMASAAAESGAFRRGAMTPATRVPAARAAARAAANPAAPATPPAMRTAAPVAPAGPVAPAAPVAPEAIAPASSSPAPSSPAPVSPPASDLALAEADACSLERSLGDDGVEPLLTAPTVPVARERDEASPARWRRGFQTSPALGLIAVVLGVAASTQVQDPPERLEPITPDVATIAAPAGDSDHDFAVVSLAADRYLVQPQQKTVEFTVERTRGSGDASFVWWTQPSSARSREDYIGTRARVVAIPEGTTSMKLQVPILVNPQRRHIDMFYVVIGNTDGGAELGPIRRAAVFIFPPDRD